MNLVSINKKKGLIASRGDKVAQFVDFGSIAIPTCTNLFKDSINKNLPNVFTETNFSVTENCIDMFANTQVEKVFLPNEINIVGSAMRMFGGCKNLVYVSKFSMPKAYAVILLFLQCSSLERIELGDIGTKSSVIYVNNMFQGCSSLRTVKIGDFGVCIDSHFMFIKDGSLESIEMGDCSKFNTSGGYDVLQESFVGCINLVDFKVKALPNENLNTWGISDCIKLSAQSVVNIIAALPINKKGCAISFNANVVKKGADDEKYTAIDIVAGEELSMGYSEWFERLIKIKDWNVNYV